MSVDAALWYDATPDATALYQGDLLDNVPVVAMPPAGDAPWILLRPAPPVTIERALAGDIPKFFRPHAEAVLADAWEGSEELVLARGTKHQVLLVTQSCDIDQRKFVHVAPIYRAARLSASRQDSLRENEINYLFFLPAAPPAHPEDAFADLSQISLVHRSYLRNASLVKRLTARGTLELQTQLARFHGRQFGFSVRDSVPQSAEYICAACFFTAGAVHRAVMSRGAHFERCPGCREDARWVKFR